MKIAPTGPVFELCQAIENSPLGVWMRASIMAIPIADALHVIAIALVLGTILIVDIRLLGIPSTRWPVTLLSDPLIRCTWLAFVISAITGAAIFVANATTYYINLAFRIKLVLIFLAGVNMMLFEFITVKTVEKWDQGVQPPLAAKVAAAASLTLWISVLVLGRITGYTKEAPFAVTVPDTLDLNSLHFK
jgi:hypothetical protein